MRIRNLGIYFAERVSPSLSELDFGDDGAAMLNFLRSLSYYNSRIDGFFIWHVVYRIRFGIKMESVIEPSLISYDFNNNNDISTMSRIPKFAQLSSTYYISFYSGILRNSCEFLN